MKRREFIALFGSGVAGWPLAARAQQIKKVGILGPAEEPRFSHITAGLRSGLFDHGYAPATLEFVERRVPRGDISGARAMAQEIVQRGAAALFVIGSELARAARQTSDDIPIVFITPGDPVAAGLVASLARPGGRTTAMTFEFPELSAKRLELLKAIEPALRRVLILYDPRDASPRQSLAAAREAAPKLGMSLIEQGTRSREEISRGLMAIESADALLAVPGGITSGHQAEIIATGNSKGRPTFSYSRAGSLAGALASYGASDTSTAREAARLVDKILKGEDAGRLPVERPTKFELVLNLRTAKTLGLEVPPHLLAVADEVIE